MQAKIATSSFVSGAITGGIGGGISAVRDGRNFWHGGKIVEHYEMELPTYLQEPGTIDCRYKVFQSFDEHYNESCSDFTYIKQKYPEVPGSESQLARMYSSRNMALSKIDKMNASSVAECLKNDMGVSIEMKISDEMGRTVGHAVAVKSISIYDNGRMQMTLMNPDRYGITKMNKINPNKIINMFKIQKFKP